MQLQGLKPGTSLQKLPPIGLGNFMLRSCLSPDEINDLINAKLRQEGIEESPDITTEEGLRFLKNGLYDYMSWVYKHRTHHSGVLEAFIHRQFGHDVADQVNGAQGILEGAPQDIRDELTLGKTYDSVLPNRGLRNVSEDPYWDRVTAYLGTYIARGMAECILYPYLDTSDKEPSIPLDTAFKVINDFLIFRKYAECQVLTYSKAEYGRSNTDIGCLEDIFRKRELHFGGAGEGIKISGAMFIVLFNIIKNAYTLYTRQVKNKEILGQNQDIDTEHKKNSRIPLGIGHTTSISRDSRHIQAIHTKLGEGLRVDIEVITQDDRQFIVISDNHLRGLDLNSLKLHLKNHDILTMDPKLNRVLKMWKAGDFSMDREVRAKLDELIFAEGFSTNGSTGIGLGMTRFLAESGIANVYAYEAVRGVVFICELLPTEKRTSTHRQKVARMVQSLMPKRAA